MKKFFLSGALMAGLLLSANVNADTLTVGNALSGATHTTLQSAVTAAKSGDVIEFVSDLADAGALVEKNITIDLNGFTYNYVKPSSNNTGTRNIKVNGKYTVTIQNGTMVGTCEVPANYASLSGGACGDGAYGTARADNGATLMLNNMTLYNYHPWGLSVKVTNSNLTLNNCVFYSTIGGGIEVNGSTATLNNCQFNQKEANKKYGWLASCINVSCLGTIYVNNSSFKSEGEHSLYVFNSGGHIVVNNGVFSGIANVIQVDAADKASLASENEISQDAAQALIDAFAALEGWTSASEIKINDGSFIGKIKVATPKDAEPAKLTVSGGKFDVQGDASSQTALENAIVPGNEKVANPDGTYSVVSTADKKSDIPSNPEDAKKAIVVVPTAASIVVNKNETKEIKQLNISNNATVTVKDGGVLKVNGQTGIVLGNSASKLVVEPGGKVMIENGLAYSQSATAIVIQSDESKSGEFLISPNVQMYGDQHPAATVQMVANIGKKADEKFAYYRFGVPMYELTTMSNSDGIDTYVLEWNHVGGKWSTVSSYKNMKPFEGYQVSTTATYGNYVYSFKGTLFGNANASAEFKGTTGQWASFANSYSARASVKSILQDAVAAGKLASIKLWDEVNHTFTQTVVLADIDDEPDYIKNVAPMRPIIFQAVQANPEMKIDYKTAVWDLNEPKKSVTPRHSAGTEASVKLSFGTTAQDSAKIKIFQDASYSDKFDAAADNVYMPNSEPLQAYSVVDSEKYASAGRNNIHETVIELVANANTTVSVSCTKVSGGSYALVTSDDVPHDLSVGNNLFSVDVVKNQPVQIRLVDKAQLPSMVEHVEATTHAKGVYSIMGQYLGEDIDVLPTGMYIVNGVKVIK